MGTGNKCKGQTLAIVDTHKRIGKDEVNPATRLAHLVAGDMARVDALIHVNMQSPVGMIPDLAAHLVDAGGKRLRPMITIATANLLGYEGDNHIRLACAVEFIHSATLLHDDIVDGSALRRGKPAANRLWGNSASVLVGDFLFARSFTLMVDTGRLPVLDILSRASSVIAEGEVHQLAQVGNLNLSQDDYLSIIEAKTAELFAAAARVSGVVAQAGEDTELALDRFGRSLGLAFQLVDDALDYAGDAQNLGKRTGDDFREGKLTLPVLLAIDRADADSRKWWETALRANERTDADLDRAKMFMHETNALKDTIGLAREHADTAKQALSQFRAGELRDCLTDLCDYVVERVS